MSNEYGRREIEIAKMQAMMQHFPTTNITATITQLADPEYHKAVDEAYERAKHARAEYEKLSPVQRLFVEEPPRV